jgi:hypothetical protein
LFQSSAFAAWNNLNPLERLHAGVALEELLGYPREFLARYRLLPEERVPQTVDHFLVVAQLLPRDGDLGLRPAQKPRARALLLALGRVLPGEE